jgi:hypothetical protein
MDRRRFLLTSLAGVLSEPLAARAQWGAGMAWAGRQLKESIEGEYDRLLVDEPK